MKTETVLKRSFLALFSAASIMLAVSCSDKDEPDAPAPTPAETVPFKSVAVKADGETATGAVEGTNITFAFDQAENFTSCQLIVDLNPGYTLTFPTDVNNYDMTDDPNLYFKNAEGKSLKYTVRVSSNALPIIDASKISVEGGYPLTVNNATKEIVITYTPGMNRKEVKLVFADGALMAGASVENNVFDLNEGPETVNIKVAGSNRAYTLRIDFSSIMTPAKELGFQDITPDDVKEKYPFISVMRATQLSNIPKQKPTSAPNPEWWNPDGFGGLEKDQAMGILGNMTDPATFPGVDNVDNICLTVVTMESNKVKGRLVVNDQNGLQLSGVKGLVTVSGRPIGSKGAAGGRGILAADSKVYCWQIPWLEKQPENIHYGWHFGFTAEGRLLCDVITTSAGSHNRLQRVQFYDSNENFHPEPYNYPNELTYDCHNYLAGDWDAVSSCYGFPCFAYDGKVLTWMQLAANNGFSDSFGDNVYGRFVVIGKTYDGKVGIATVTKESDTDNELTPLQAAYVLNKLGWKDIMCVGITDWQSGNWNPGIMIDGKVVAGQDTDGSVSVIAFDAK